MDIRDHLIYKGEKFFTGEIGMFHHFKRIDVKIENKPSTELTNEDDALRNRIIDKFKNQEIGFTVTSLKNIFFEKIKDCNEILILEGNFPNDPGKVAIILKDDVSGIDINEINDKISNVRPMGILLNVFVLPFEIFQESINHTLKITGEKC